MKTVGAKLEGETGFSRPAFFLVDSSKYQLRGGKKPRC